jgi:hypothetical protein
MKKLVRGLLLAGFSVSAVFVLPAYAGVKVVNCDKGDSLQAALDSGKGSAAPIEIELYGTCEEMITIPRDRVTILGIDGATIFGQVRHFGASHITLRGLTITGPGQGVLARSGRMRLIGVNLIENYGHGVNASSGAVVHLIRSQVGNNGGPFGVVAYASNVYLNSTDVYGHPESGVAATDNSLADIFGGSITGNGEGVYGNNSVITVRDTWIGDNYGMGISLGGARTTLFDVTISRTMGAAAFSQTCTPCSAWMVRESLATALTALSLCVTRARSSLVRPIFRRIIRDWLLTATMRSRVSKSTTKRRSVLWRVAQTSNSRKEESPLQ